jgi:hypothetical protein
VTAAATARAAARPGQLSAEALAVLERFPPRPVPESWPETSADRFTVARRILAPPFALGGASSRHARKLGILKLLDWLELHPGQTWQQRWDSSGAEAVRSGDWRDRVMSGLDDAGRLSPLDARLHIRLGAGMTQLIGGDVIRPGLPWLLTTPAPVGLADEMGRVRDPAGMTALTALREVSTTGRKTFDLALERVAVIMAAKGGTVAAITPGDCVELLGCCQSVLAAGPQTNPFSPFFYQLLAAAGAFPPGARPRSGCSAAGSPDSSPPSRWSTATTWPAARSGTSSWTTCSSGSPASTTAPWWAWPSRWASGSGRTWRPTTPASAPCTCHPTSPPPGSSASRQGPSARPAAGSSPSPASLPATP